MAESPCVAESPVEEDDGPSLEFLACDVDIDTRTIWLGAIEEDTAEKFIKAMHVLLKHNDHPIHILMNSPGGHWPNALAIYDCIMDSDAPVSIECYGQCMSAAPVIVQACEQRWIHPNCVVMIHDGQHGGEGDTRTFVSWGRYADLERKRMFKILSRKAFKTAAFWRNKCAKLGDYHMPAAQAVKFGLFDQLTREDDE
jgi:ATP-dependent Clp protease protease subunit